MEFALMEFAMQFSGKASMKIEQNRGGKHGDNVPYELVSMDILKNI